MIKEPISRSNLIGIGYYELEFNRDHGTDFNSWHEIESEIIKWTDDVGDLESFYEAYLNWFSIRQTPLMKALK